MFPILYAKNKNGVIKTWEIRIVLEKDIPMIDTEYGQINGKKVSSRRPVLTLKRGHNSLLDYARFLAQSKWNHKKEREGYSESQEKKEPVYPMLAKTFDQGKHLIFPCFVQPKIDGLRCIATWNGESVNLTSRTNVTFQSTCLQNIKNVLQPFFRQYPTLILDGELYADQVPFEELSGSIRKGEADIEVYFLVFDVVDETKSFEERFLPLDLRPSPYLKRLETHLVNSLDDAMTLHRQFIKKGYEGSIFRNRKGKYKKGYRSFDLQKYKNFFEEEFEIVGFHEGEGGREKGSVIWECRNEEGKVFRVRPRGSLEYRRKMFLEGDVHIGDFLTVIYQEKTSDGIPRFPVGKEIRKNY